MQPRATWLAALVLLAVLAGAYQAGWRLMTRQLARETAARLTRERAAIAADSVEQAAYAASRARADSAAAVVRAREDSVAATPTPSPADTATGYQAGPIRVVPGSPAARRPWQQHRYVGTVGGQPAVALLEWQNPDSVQGRCYLPGQGAAYELYCASQGPGQLALSVEQEHPLDEPAGEWCLAGRPGARLTGTWRAPRLGQTLAIQLRESYAGALRLTLETTFLRGGWALCDNPDHPTCCAGCDNLPTVAHQFLHLPGPATGPPALRPLLSPTRAMRQHRTQAARASDGQVTASLTLKLNDAQLLAYQLDRYIEFFPGYGTSDNTRRGSPLLDVATGQAWPLGRLLRPGYQPALRRLIGRHLLHDAKFRDYAWSWAVEPGSSLADDTTMNQTLWLRREVVPRPEAYVFTHLGLELTYRSGNLSENKDHPSLQVTVLVPYAELRPLLRPGTPLRRLLPTQGQ